MADIEQRVQFFVKDGLYKKLMKEATRRKVNREEGASISGVMRDALEEFFSKKKKAA